MMLSKLHADGACLALPREARKMGWVMENGKALEGVKLGWTLEEVARRSLGVSVPFLRLEVKRGKLRADRLSRRVVLLDVEVRRYLAEASNRAA